MPIPTLHAKRYKLYALMFMLDLCRQVSAGILTYRAALVEKAKISCQEFGKIGAVECWLCLLSGIVAQNQVVIETYGRRPLQTKNRENQTLSVPAHEEVYSYSVILLSLKPLPQPLQISPDIVITRMDYP